LSTDLFVQLRQASLNSRSPSETDQLKLNLPARQLVEQRYRFSTSFCEIGWIAVVGQQWIGNRELSSPSNSLPGELVPQKPFRDREGLFLAWA
jgi:hypothetical protein